MSMMQDDIIIKNAKIHHNLSSAELIQMAVARKEGILANNQALAVTTGSRTGRSPKDRFIVKDAMTSSTVDWNQHNQPLDNIHFEKLWDRALEHLNNVRDVFVSDLAVGAEDKFSVGVRIITELAWHTLFAKDLFLFQNAEANFLEKWTIISVPTMKTASAYDGVYSDAAIILNFTQHKILVCGTLYAGEIKKAMFTVMNFILPPLNVLPMHCAANMDDDGKTTLFFGLSGTGKTTLSADPQRLLIGDDEHGWGDGVIFNFEGGCYAKCVDLTRETEPVIWDAIRYGAIMENVMLDVRTKEPLYEDTGFTENTRAAYPREYIEQRAIENKGRAPQAIIFLTCDLYGVLPPVAKLTKEQAAYYFLSGYTAQVGSTVVGSGKNIKPTFSACFGAPFFPRSPQVYADLLIKRLKKNPADVYLVNTGWSGGAHGEGGHRFPIPVTRNIVTAIINGELKKAKYENYPGFNIAIPLYVSNVENKILNPRNHWLDKIGYDHYAKILIDQFNENFKNFNVASAIANAAPKMELSHD